MVETIFKKSLIASPFLALVFLVYGVNHEHGDTNAGSMYPLVFAVQYFILSILSYILFFIIDKLTAQTKWNSLKNFVHLILGLGLIWFQSPIVVLIAVLTLPTLLIVNLITVFFNSIPKNL